MKEPSVFLFTKRSDIEAITAAVAVHAPHVLPLFRAVRDGFVHLLQPQRDAQVHSKLLEWNGKPKVVLLGDDDYESTGPEGWACAIRVRQRANSIKYSSANLPSLLPSGEVAGKLANMKHGGDRTTEQGVNLPLAPNPPTATTTVAPVSVAAAGEPEHYENALTGTLLAGRFLLVETSADQQPAWQAFMKSKMPLLTIIPRDGIHPARPSPSEVQ